MMGNQIYPKSTQTVIKNLEQRHVAYSVDGYGNITARLFKAGREVWERVLTVHA